MFNYSPFHSFPFAKSDSTAAVVPNIELNTLDLLANFYVTCPKLAVKEEEEHKRILYFYPSEESPKRKAEISGMAGAVVGFTSELIRLSNNSANENQSKRKHRFILSTKTASIVLPVEDDFIIGLTFNRELCDQKSYYPHPGTLLKIVENIYETYKLFYGPFHLAFEKETKTKDLELRLNIFFSNYLPTIKLSTVPLVDYLDGISFMPLSAKLFLETQCFIEQASEEFPEVKQIMFLYQNRLGQHSIEKQELKTLFRFVTEHLIPHSLTEELCPQGISFTQSGHFVKASFDFAPQKGPYPLIKLPNSKTQKLEAFHLIIFRSLNATLCMLMPETDDPTLVLNKLQQFLQMRTAELGSAMGETMTNLNRPLITTVPFHFIYYNYDSLSFRTSLKVVAQQPGNAADTITFNKEINKAVYQAFDKFLEQTNENTHLDLKINGNLCVGFKKCNQRLLVIFIPNSANSTPNDMYNYFTSILQTHFDHILLE